VSHVGIGCLVTRCSGFSAYDVSSMSASAVQKLPNICGINRFLISTADVRVVGCCEARGQQHGARSLAVINVT